MDGYVRCCQMKITRDDLLIAAFKLFMSMNCEKASFAELGKMLGMSKAGIFKFYKNKQELFIAVVDKLVQHEEPTKQVHRNERHVCRIYRRIREWRTTDNGYVGQPDWHR